MNKSFDDPDTSGLCFDSQDDALNFANKSVEDSIRWLSIHNVNFCHRYEHLNLEIVIDACSMSNSNQYHLIFRAVPSGWDFKGNQSLEISMIEHGAACRHGDGGNDFMFVGITKLVQGPEKIIPSFVWLKRHHEIKDVFMDILGASCSSTFHVSERGAKGEMCVPPTISSSHGDRVSDLIKGGTQTANNIKGDTGKPNWHGLNELNLMSILNSVRIEFNDSGVWVSLEENRYFPFKLTKTTLGVLDTVF